MKKVLLIIGMLLFMVFSALDAQSATLTHNELIKKARTSLNDGDYQDTLDYARQAIDMDENSASGHYFAARALDKLGKADQALMEYEISLYHEPDNFYALNNAGLLYLKKGELESALEVLEKAVATDEPEAYAFNNLGYVYERLGMKENAIDAYKKSVALNPDYIRASDNLIRVTAERDMEMEAAKESATREKDPVLSSTGEPVGYFQFVMDMVKKNEKHAMNF